jgi:hypothetical protein
MYLYVQAKVTEPDLSDDLKPIEATISLEMYLLINSWIRSFYLFTTSKKLDL